MTQAVQQIEFSEKLPTLDQLTFVLVMEALYRVGGNRSLAAEILGISSRAIDQKINEYKIANITS